MANTLSGRFGRNPEWSIMAEIDWCTCCIMRLLYEVFGYHNIFIIYPPNNIIHHSRHKSRAAEVLKQNWRLFWATSSIPCRPILTTISIFVTYCKFCLKHQIVHHVIVDISGVLSRINDFLKTPFYRRHVLRLLFYNITERQTYLSTFGSFIKKKHLLANPTENHLPVWN